jgi:SRSO17 transposase
VDLGAVAALNGELARFVHEVFVPDQPVRGALRRAEMWAHHLRGSMLTDIKRKTAAGMARVLGVPAQSLNHLVTDSPWVWEPVQHRIAARAQQLLRPSAWVVDDSTFLKDGPDSVGVSRQHSGSAGKTANCQAAVSVTAAGRAGAIALAWRLFMPASWNPGQADERRAVCRVPEDVVHRRKWELALEGIDALRAQGLHAPPILADRDYGRVMQFRAGLAQRGLGFVVMVNPGISVLPWRSDPDTAWARKGKHVSAATIVAQTAGIKKIAVSWHNTNGPQVARFSLLRVREAGLSVRQHASTTNTPLPDRWLLVEWDEHGDKPVAFWLAHLPDTARPTVQRLVKLAKTRWAIETGYRELKDTLGLDHFEGRTWPGWHRHVTLVTAAQLFLTEHRAASAKDAAPA